ncbi:serine hydrolase [Antrihabitans cavernicola]|uniref:serine hydrolase n=1 Tax=Antrihabitans cavernicola TaxID=2495913 RepID=UPI001F340AFE|nr:serine hydrolase [Spelaeibacter cavernicola]
MRTTSYLASAVALAIVVGLTACGSDEDASASPTSSAPSAQPTDCAPLPEPDTTSVPGWIGYLGAHGDDTGLAIDNGTGTRIDHRPDDKRPLASTVKVVHLAAYAQAAATGRIDPDQQIPVADWERWYLPGSDGDAHPRALARLGNPTSVTIDQLVSAMMQESDNAAADYLLDRLGDTALTDAARTGGWQDFAPASKLGSMLRAKDATITVGNERDAARRYVAEPAYRKRMAALPLPGIDEQVAWADTTEAGSAADVASIMRSIATGEFGPGADVARRQLEWQPTIPGLTAVGFKSGSLPGVLTDAFYIRRPDGTVGTAVLLNRRMPTESWAGAVQSLPEQQLLLAALLKPEAAGQLQCAV